jgi:predicted nucleic acid-binding protein
MIVVDTSIIGYLYLASPHSRQAEQVLLKDADWAAPLLWRSEFRNVLALYLRKHWLSLEASQQVMTEALSLMEDREYEVDSDQVLKLVTLSSCSAYDCEFVALAQELGVSCVTVDKQLLSDFPKVAVSLAAFVGDHEPGG